MSVTDRLAAEVTTIALCWRLARADGVVLGFTSHDAPVDVDGLRYEASPGMTPSAIGSALGFEVETMEFTGALTANAISGVDLGAGRFDGARLEVFMIDWDAPDTGTLALARGTLGQVERHTTQGNGSFTATVRGPTAALEALAVESCSPMCRAELGDRRCRVDVAPLTAIAHVAAGSSRDRIRIADVVLDDRFVDGRLQVLTGGGAGSTARIVGIDGNALVLIECLPYDVAAGGMVELRQGCDKRFASCADRFGNAANFQGEPHVPGSDVLTRFPGV